MSSTSITTIAYGTTRAVDRLSFTAEQGVRCWRSSAPTAPARPPRWRPPRGLPARHRGQRVRVLGLDPVADHARLVPQIGVMPRREAPAPASGRSRLELFAAFHATPHDPNALLEAGGPTCAAPGGSSRGRAAAALAGAGPRGPTQGGVPRRADRQRRRARAPAHPSPGPRSLRTRACAWCSPLHDLDEAEKVADQVVIDRWSPDHPGDAERAHERGRQGREIRFARGARTRRWARWPRSTRCRPASTSWPPSRRRPIATLTGWLADRDLPLADLGVPAARSPRTCSCGFQITGEVPAVRRPGSGPAAPAPVGVGRDRSDRRRRQPPRLGRGVPGPPASGGAGPRELVVLRPASRCCSPSPSPCCSWPSSRSSTCSP